MKLAPTEILAPEVVAEMYALQLNEYYTTVDLAELYHLDPFDIHLNVYDYAEDNHLPLLDCYEGEDTTVCLTRRHLLANDYYAITDEQHLYIENNASYNETIRRHLAHASKTGKGGKGYPDIIIHNTYDPHTILVIECKANIERHRGSMGDNDPRKYAVEGVLNYAKHLHPNYNVIALAISGQTMEELLITSYIWDKHHDTPIHLPYENELLTWDEYSAAFTRP